jgi:methylated-DNA-protein-cysteine methyltransferase-like protein
MPPGSPFTDLTVPAHRVVNRYGQCTGRRFFPGDTMIERLQQEGIAFTEEGQVHLENHYWDDFREG